MKRDDPRADARPQPPARVAANGVPADVDSTNAAVEGAIDSAPDAGADDDDDATRAQAEATEHPLKRHAWLMALAAFVVVAYAVSILRGSNAALVIEQRVVTGLAGEADASAGADVSSAPKNIEVSIHGASIEAARLIVTDTRGAVLAPPAELSEGADDGWSAFVAPHALKKHDGVAIAWVVVGGRAAVAQTFEMLAASPDTLGGPDVAGSEEFLMRAAGRAGARATRAELQLAP